MTEGLQPFLSDAVVALCAPTQVWSGRAGDLGGRPIDGVYHGDTRFVRELAVTYSAGDERKSPEPISVAEVSASTVEFGALLRGVDDRWPDPKVRLLRRRTVSAGVVRERLTVRSHLDEPTTTALRLRLVPDATSLPDVKAGVIAESSLRAVPADGGIRIEHGESAMTIAAPGAAIEADDAVTLEWEVRCPPHGEWSAEVVVTLHDPALVVRAGSPAPRWTGAYTGDASVDPRLRRWAERALSDLDALRLALPGAPGDEFLAAGAPWFFTLFGRDSLWAARLMLPVDVGIAASTLRVLAGLQGMRSDPATAEEPGKILHELRAGQFAMPGEGIVLPPVYYGTVDATPLWVALLAEAREAGMPDAEVRALLPHLRAALGWIVASAGDSGFLDYVDETGHGLSNQGWKDSGDSIQWRDGTLAQGPIALCEVQGYAYEAAVAGADLLDALGEDGAEELRAWAAGMRQRFGERFWVTTAEGAYPAIALDRDGAAVDTLTSNIGHLLGTGILDPEQERSIAALLTSDAMSSGFGVRTMSTGAAGYWPLSYHGGSVWPHDAAIVARGMARAGCRDEALAVVDGLLAAAEAFAFRMPELYAGDARTDTPVPAPYPAACRPQAWSAAAAITCLEIVRAR
ncbi:glycogen debranching N-terminal domain-containing protein [Microbacterium sp. BK668]|uniref:glycogen debranching N-terminal domain-containing protein n=1 Tax=Microbacterium sp. BK668 TaxID=2512118 RepID=UPI00105CA1CA|nr:glycogen debranching N-terminal domain-containing protein [Microbacterium sp. BK668]TDN92264.1 amylo-alpha-1,6-glucosidase [Microbacterium sp. BK668]